MNIAENLLEEVIETAKAAGAFIRKQSETFEYSQVEMKGRNDLVSYVDKTAEEIIVNKLHTLLPEAGFVVEENTRSEKKECNWIVDPLDGTTNFIHGIPCFAVSIALEYAGEILLGVVYEVNRDECFYAEKNKGAFLNGKKIQVSSREKLSESLVATGFPIYNFEHIHNYFKALHHFMQHTHGLRRIGAAAADLCYLACGRVDAFFEYNLKPWDVAAGALIVMEAGGKVYDFKGGHDWLYGKELSASNALLDKEFNSVILNCFT
jgi:myo-inositol-1(or 4)-monophosphatase